MLLGGNCGCYRYQSEALCKLCADVVVLLLHQPESGVKERPQGSVSKLSQVSMSSEHEYSDISKFLIHARKCADGTRYCGQFLDDLRHGHGFFASAPDCSYAGSWAYGERDGLGIAVEVVQTKQACQGIGGQKADALNEQLMTAQDENLAAEEANQCVGLAPMGHDSIKRCIVSCVAEFRQGRRVRRIVDLDTVPCPASSLSSPLPLSSSALLIPRPIPAQNPASSLTVSDIGLSGIANQG